MHLNAFFSLDETINALEIDIVSNVNKTVESQNYCSMALAGGSTPQPLYRSLSESNLPWEKMILTLTDERWVAEDHGDSNQNMINQCLLKKVGPRLKFVPLKNSQVTAKLGTPECEALLSNSVGALDIVVLGMGDDGHFASIFPSTQDLAVMLDQNNLNKCMAVSPQGKQERISLTLSYLLSASVIYLFITGEKKKEIIDQIIAKQASAKRYPIDTLLNQATCPVNIYWNA